MSEANFQPTMLGTLVSFEDQDCAGMITDETLGDIYVESEFFTGWMSKVTFWEYAGDE